jgi:hypothetical protein
MENIRIRDGKKSDPGSGIYRTSRIRNTDFTPGGLLICYVVYRNVANMSINSPAMVVLQQKMTEAR